MKRYPASEADLNTQYADTDNRSRAVDERVYPFPDVGGNPSKVKRWRSELHNQTQPHTPPYRMDDTQHKQVCQLVMDRHDDRGWRAQSDK